MAQIETLRPDEWLAAMHGALAHVPEELRSPRALQCVQLLETGTLDPRGVFVARQARAIVGVQVCVPLAGSACLFWLPAADDDLAEALVQAGLDWCRTIGCKFAQALASSEEAPRTEPLRRRGFRAITRMHQLGHALGDLPEFVPTLRLQTYRPSRHAEFVATLERTYEGTLDCPELNGTRTIHEILEGHRGQGIYHPEFWWLAYDGALPIGVVMLTELADGLTWELAYLGLVPEARRRGFGRALALHALHVLRTLPATRLVVALDERNTPAQRLYQSLGFFEIESNDVLLHFLSPRAA